jgi:hypothetical protein
MLAEALMALASLAGTTVVAAATTDAWEAARHKFVQLLGRGDPKREQLAGGRLEETRKLLTGAKDAELEQTRTKLAERWADRLADLLEEDLRTVVEEIQAQLPAEVVSAADHAVAAGRDVNIRADRGGVAAGTIHGDVTPGPTSPGAAGS